MSPIYVPGKVVLAKQFTQQSYMWEFPAQYGLWSPANITTALWLDAADTSTVTTVSGAVSQWNDKSGNNRHATATSTARPTFGATAFNSKPGLTFDGTANVLRADALATIAQGNDSPFSTVAVFNALSGSTFRNIAGFGSSGGADYFHTYQISDSNVLLQSRRTTTSPLIQKNVTGSSGASSNIITGFTFSGTTGLIYKNGTQDATGDLDVDTFGSSPNQFAIGALPRNTTSGFLAFTLAELVITTGVLSTTNRQKLEGYLAHKWGLTANLPAGHPYKTVGPTP